LVISVLMRLVLNVHFADNQIDVIFSQSSDKLYIRERIGVFLLIITAKIMKNMKTRYFLSILGNKKCLKQDFGYAQNNQILCFFGHHPS
jgi:hypothetical protein